MAFTQVLRAHVDTAILNELENVPLSEFNKTRSIHLMQKVQAAVNLCMFANKPQPDFIVPDPKFTFPESYQILSETKSKEFTKAIMNAEIACQANLLPILIPHVGNDRAWRKATFNTLYKEFCEFTQLYTEPIHYSQLGLEAYSQSIESCQKAKTTLKSAYLEALCKENIEAEKNKSTSTEKKEETDEKIPLTELMKIKEALTSEKRVEIVKALEDFQEEILAAKRELIKNGDVEFLEINNPTSTEEEKTLAFYNKYPENERNAVLVTADDFFIKRLPQDI